MKRYINTLIAVIVLAALWAGFNYYNKRKAKETTADANKPKELVVPVKQDQVRSFTIAPHEGEAITCTLEGKTWAISQPRPRTRERSLSVPGKTTSSTSTPRSRTGFFETTTVSGATVPRAQHAKS